MQNTNSLYGNFLKKIAALPVVHQMVNEENKRTASEAVEARKACIAQLKILRISEAKAQKDLDLAATELRKAEKGIDVYRERVIALNQPFSDASRARSNLEQELHREHGESLISAALYKIQMARNQAANQIVILTAELSPHIFVDGRLSFRPVSPTIKPKLEETKRQLEVIEKAFVTAQSLVEADIGPLEVQTRCEKLLAEAGCKSHVVESV